MGSRMMAISESCPICEAEAGSAQNQWHPGSGCQVAGYICGGPAQNTSSGGFWEKLGNFVTGNGWKTDAELHPSQSVIDKDKVAITWTRMQTARATTGATVQQHVVRDWKRAV